jgi:hypothetical protein
LAIEIVGQGADIRPVDGLPAIRDADVNVRISGRTATINVGRGSVELSPDRKLSITSGIFEVPDTFPKSPPAKARFRLDGSVPAALELLALERLRGHSSTPLEPGTSRGTLTAQVTLGLPLKKDLAPGSTTYTINMDVSNFAAERMVMGQKVEAAMLKVSANNYGYWIRGDVKLNGVPAALDYRKPNDADAEVRIQANLDDNARNKLGFDFGGLLSGSVPIKLIGQLPSAMPKPTASRWRLILLRSGSTICCRAGRNLRGRPGERPLLSSIIRPGRGSKISPSRRPTLPSKAWSRLIPSASS